MAWLKDRLKAMRTRAGALRPPSPKIRRRIAWTGGTIGGLLVVLVLFLGLVDWNMLKRPVEGLLSSRTGRQVHIDGNLSVHLLSWSPSATLQGLRISNPAWLGAGDMAKIERLSVKVKLLPLFRGQVILPLLQLDRPTIALVRAGDGRDNWTFGRKNQKPLALPPIRRFDLNDGHVTINDAQRHMIFAGVMNSSETDSTANTAGFRLLGQGTLNTAPFTMTLTGGPLLNVNPNKPYPFDLDVRAGASHAVANGSIAKPFDLGVLNASLTLNGDDLAKLYDLTGLTFPNTPPYQVTGQFARRGQLYSYSNASGRIGSSDVRGELSVRTGGARPLLTADVKTHKLVFADLAALFGGGGDVNPSPKASPQQAARARVLAADLRLFPDTPIHVERLRTMDAHVKFAADSIESKTWPLRSGSVEVALQDGLLTADPMQFTLSNGRLSGMASLNARSDVPAIQTDLHLSGARIDEFIPAAYKGAASGEMLGRARLTSHGVSVRQAAANASGQISVVVPQGEMRSNVAELLGVDVLQALFDNPEKKTPLRCAVADFKVTDGMAKAQTIVLDTGPVIATGGGTVNLKTERMDLHLQGHPKQVRLVRLRIPLALTGPMRRPHLGVEAGSAAGQAGLAALVGTVLAPLAAILPFIDAGMAKDANCQALVNQAGTGNPAPVQPTQKTAGTPSKSAG